MSMNTRWLFILLGWLAWAVALVLSFTVSPWGMLGYVLALVLWAIPTVFNIRDIRAANNRLRR